MTVVNTPAPAAVAAHAVTAKAPAGAFAGAERLDRLLGDPWSPENPYGFAAGVARDAAEEYPHEAEARLRAEDFHLCHLPGALGGTLRSFEDTQLLVRVAARRDVNVMPATMFSISAVMTVLAAGRRPSTRSSRAGCARAAPSPSGSPRNRPAAMCSPTPAR